MNFKLPSRAEVGYLDPEIAGEGMRVELSEGDEVSWTPPPAKPVVPDFSQIKTIRKYFNRTGFSPWPAMIYHPSEEPKTVHNAEEAGKYGIVYRKTSADESARFGKTAVWDWIGNTLWRPVPYERDTKFNVTRLGQGKTYIPTPANPVNAQHELVKALIPEVAAAVALALKNNGPGAPPSVKPAEWDEFLQFQAWKKTTQVVEEFAEAAEAEVAEDDVPLEPLQSNALSVSEERTLWEEEAAAKGIKIDGRWSLARLKEEVAKAA